MRLANLDGRAQILVGEAAFDVEEASGGRFPAGAQAVFDHWDDLRAWEATVDWANSPPVPATPVSLTELGPPAPHPRQCFGIGLNYRQHAAEAHLPVPSAPVVFTKFPSCLAGAHSPIPLPSATVDWEVELVVVVGRGGVDLTDAEAWGAVAGVTVGQDISDRIVQQRPPVPQFSLGKSFPGFGPFGPTIVTVDEVDDPDDLEIRCSVNGQQVQSTRTNDLIFSVPEIISYLSSIVRLYPGDVIFTGTPSGVGGARNPKWFLAAGDVLDSEIPGVGAMRNLCTAAPEWPYTSRLVEADPSVAPSDVTSASQGATEVVA